MNDKFYSIRSTRRNEHLPQFQDPFCNPNLNTHLLGEGRKNYSELTKYHQCRMKSVHNNKINKPIENNFVR